MKISGRKCVGMHQAVYCFAIQFAGRRRRVRVAIVALSNRVVARFVPGIVMLLHHMAVRTCLRIVAEIGRALGVVKCIGTGSQRSAHGNAHGHNGQFGFSVGTWNPVSTVSHFYSPMNSRCSNQNSWSQKEYYYRRLESAIICRLFLGNYFTSCATMNVLDGGNHEDHDGVAPNSRGTIANVRREVEAPVHLSQHSSPRDSAADEMWRSEFNTSALNGMRR